MYDGVCAHRRISHRPAAAASDREGVDQHDAPQQDRRSLVVRMAEQAPGRSSTTPQANSTIPCTATSAAAACSVRGRSSGSRYRDVPGCFIARDYVRDHGPGRPGCRRFTGRRDRSTLVPCAPCWWSTRRPPRRQRQLDVLTRALGSDLKVDLVETDAPRSRHRARRPQAVESGLDLVVVLGGDGTINEVVNGLLGSGPWQGQPRRPGARHRAWRQHERVQPRPGHRPRPGRRPPASCSTRCAPAGAGRIGLGRVDDRWFTFTAGLGLDADAVRRVEVARAKGKPRHAEPLRPRARASAPDDGPSAPAR